MKNKLQRFKIAKRIILFAFALTLSNCQVEEEQTQQESRIKTVSTNEAKDFLAQAKVNSKSKSSKTERENIDFKKITQEKINGSDQLLTVIPFATTNEVRNDRVLLMKIGGEIKSVIFSMQPEENSVKGSFSGKIFIYSLDGFFLNGYRAKNGIIVSQFIKTTKASLTSKQDGEALKEVIVTNNYHGVKFVNYFYFETIWGSGGSSIAGGGQGMSWDAGMGDVGSGITAPSPAQIIDELTGKAKCIYEKLKSSSLAFENAIKKFDGDFTVSHLKLTINNSLPLNVYGETQLPVDFITEIQINNNGLNNLSDLGKAMVFAHEIIHAEIFRKMLSAAQIGTLTPDSSNMNAQQQVNYINSMKDNFPGLYDYYYKRYKPTWNHEMMANHYRETIADIIQQFDNNRLPRSTYEAVSWLGLGKLDIDVTTIAWDNLSETEKTRVTDLINENFYKGPSNCN
jgi:hypothetical protein